MAISGRVSGKIQQGNSSRVSDVRKRVGFHGDGANLSGFGLTRWFQVDFGSDGKERVFGSNGNVKMWLRVGFGSDGKTCGFQIAERR